MPDRGDGGVRGATETLQGGPDRPPWWQRVPARWRTPAAAFLAFVLGVAGGAGAVAWRESGPEPAPFRVDEHAVELVLFREAKDRSPPSGAQPTVDPLTVDGALLLSGLVTSSVVAIKASGAGLAVRVPALPVTVSTTGRYREVVMEVTIRNCEDASRWVPADRPFVITWRDEYGREHVDRAGDFGPSVGAAFARYVEAVCRSG